MLRHARGKHRGASIIQPHESTWIVYGRTPFLD
jgi:hypothetical protein